MQLIYPSPHTAIVIFNPPFDHNLFLSEGIGRFRISSTPLQFWITTATIQPRYCSPPEQFSYRSGYCLFRSRVGDYDCQPKNPGPSLGAPSYASPKPRPNLASRGRSCRIPAHGLTIRWMGPTSTSPFIELPNVWRSRVAILTERATLMGVRSFPNRTAGSNRAAC